jgi:hypothetical protein
MNMKRIRVKTELLNTALQTLAELKRAELHRDFPGVPDYALPRTKYTDKTANDLTKCIIDYIKVTGGHAERVANTGRQIGHGVNRKWIPGTGTNGSADISATKPIEISGRKVGIKVAIEVKIGRDEQSPAQKKYQYQVEQSGGVYIIARDFESFLEQWERI